MSFYMSRCSPLEMVFRFKISMKRSIASSGLAQIPYYLFLTSCATSDSDWSPQGIILHEQILFVKLCRDPGRRNVCVVFKRKISFIAGVRFDTAGRFC